MSLTKIFKSISRREWLVLGLVALAVMAITTLPLLYGWLIAGPDRIFTGIHFQSLNDWFVYYSYLEQARDGRLLFSNLYTGEPQAPQLNIFWLALGLAAKIFPAVGNVMIFNVSRLLLIPIFFVTVYLLIAAVFSRIKERLLALLFLSFSSGLGFLLIYRIVLFPENYANGHFNWPLDLWVPESNTFLTLYYTPHFIASLALIVLIFLLTLLFSGRPNYWYSVVAGLAALLLIAFHPFHLLTVFAVTGVFALVIIWQNRKMFWPFFVHFLILGAGVLPPVWYYARQLATDKYLLLKAVQNQCPITPLWLTIIGYGLILALALIGAAILWRKKTKLANGEIFILVWAIVQFFIIYAPVNYQRRMTEGLQVPLVLLAAIGLFYLAEKIWSSPRPLARLISQNRELAFAVLLILLSLSNIFALAVDGYIYRSAATYSYLSRETMAAIVWLKNAGPDVIILNSAPDGSNPLPAYSGRRVFVGHGVETLNYRSKQTAVEWFFAANRPVAVERDFLARRKISYIFYGPKERLLGAYDPELKQYLQPVYENSEVIIYRVEDD